MVEIKWKEPPAGPKAPTGPALIVDELKKHPGRWAVVKERMSSRGAADPFRKLGCEVRILRAEVPGKYRYDVYARWPERASKAVTKDSEPAPLPVPSAGPQGAAGRPLELIVNGQRTGFPIRPGETPAAALARYKAARSAPKGGAYTPEARKARGVPEEGTMP